MTSALVAGWLPAPPIPRRRPTPSPPPRPGRGTAHGAAGGRGSPPPPPFPRGRPTASPADRSGRGTANGECREAVLATCRHVSMRGSECNGPPESAVVTGGELH